LLFAVYLRAWYPYLDLNKPKKMPTQSPKMENMRASLPDELTAVVSVERCY